MITIAALAISAIIALRSYNNAMTADPEGTSYKMGRIGQALAVVITIGEAVWAIFDALKSRTRGRFSGQQGGGNVPLRTSSLGTRNGGPDGED